MKRSIIKSMSCFMLCFSIFNLQAQEDNLGSGVLATNPTMSHDMQWIAVSANYDSPDAVQKIWLARADGSQLQAISQISGSLGDKDPAWAPDDQHIVLTSLDQNNSNIWKIPLNPIRPAIQLTSHALNNSQPAWTPDGLSIVFVSDRAGSSDIWIMNADGSGQKRLTNLPGDEDHPSVSPDGKKIVFAETLGDRTQLMVMDLDGHNLHAITDNSAKDWNPVWGTQGIIFSSNRDQSSEHFKIWSIQPDGSGLAKVFDVIALDPSWTATGNIVFADETANSKATSVASLLNTQTGKKSYLINQAGYLANFFLRPIPAGGYHHSDDRGFFYVAILSSPTLAPFTEIDRTSLRLGSTGNEKSLVNCSKLKRDVNRDGIPDLLCLFSIRQAHIDRASKYITLEFDSLKKIFFQGAHSILEHPHHLGHDDGYREDLFNNHGD